MASLLINRSEPAVGPSAPCGRCAGRATWLEGEVHTIDLATGERRSSPAFYCANCGALVDEDLDGAPAERTRARAHSPAARGLHVLDILKDGAEH